MHGHLDSTPYGLSALLSLSLKSLLKMHTVSTLGQDEISAVELPKLANRLFLESQSVGKIGKRANGCEHSTALEEQLLSQNVMSSF